MDRPRATAAFRNDDEDCLVAASLACPGCLSAAVECFLSPHGYDPRVDCTCHRCGLRHTVFLTPSQALRLALHRRRPQRPDIVLNATSV